GLPMEDANFIIAAKQGDFDLVEYLFLNTQISSINATDENEYTALYHASENGHTEIVKFLLYHNADVHIHGKENFYPIHRACRNGHLA
ncbi:ankyrin repeat domain-containing protein, partial [Escherichia coli]|nr:ankyrin repeat domain-containing protein [Escherichia coli]